MRRALRDPSRAGLEWRGGAPDRGALLVTVHSNPLRLLRYLLRAKGFPVASISRTDPGRRPDIARDEQRVDRRFPFSLPHRLHPESVRAILRTLRTASVLTAVDLQVSVAVSPAALKGRLALTPKPFRLARIAGASCRPVFVRSGPTGLEIIVEEAIDVSDERRAAESFGSILARNIEESPFDMLNHDFRIDGP